MSKDADERSIHFDLPDTCKICQENVYKYCCPRCNILYCSLTCYKSPLHSDCSESFYKDCIAEEMASMDQNPESKKKMEEILTKMNKTNDIDSNNLEEIDTNFMDGDQSSEENDSLDSDDNDSIPDLALRIKDIDLNNSNAVWDALTDEEKKEFEHLLQKDITHILPKWEPWWVFHDEIKMIVEMDDSKPKYNYKEVCPNTLNNIIDFAKISKNPPAECLKYNIINVLSSYVYMTRIFQGDYQSLHNEASYCLISLSINLNNNSNFDDLESSIMAVMQESYNHPTFSMNPEAYEQIKADVKHLMTGPEESNKSFYVQSALSDMYNLLIKYKSNESSAKNTAGKQFSKIYLDESNKSMSVPKEKIKKVLKKLEYYQSFNAAYGSEICNNIVNDIFFQTITIN